MDPDIVINNNPGLEVIVALVVIADCPDGHCPIDNMSPKCHMYPFDSMDFCLSGQPLMVTGTTDIAIPIGDRA